LPFQHPLLKALGERVEKTNASYVDLSGWFEPAKHWLVRKGDGLEFKSLTGRLESSLWPGLLAHEPDVRHRLEFHVSSGIVLLTVRCREGSFKE
jgi:hypothetical protein